MDGEEEDHLAVVCTGKLKYIDFITTGTRIPICLQDLKVTPLLWKSFRLEINIFE